MYYFVTSIIYHDTSYSDWLLTAIYHSCFLLPFSVFRDALSPPVDAFAFSHAEQGRISQSF
jgi:hypothetical protein